MCDILIQEEVRLKKQVHSINLTGPQGVRKKIRKKNEKGK